MTNIRKNSIVYLDNKELDIETVTSLFKNLNVNSIASQLSIRELRLMVKSYYIAQDHRIRLDNQISQIEKHNQENPENPQPYLGLKDTANFFRGIEERNKNIMDIYTSIPTNVGAVWAKSICGIGPVLSAGFVVNIDIRKAPTCSPILSYFGQNPNLKWVTNETKIEALIKSTLEEHNQTKINEFIVEMVCAKLNRKSNQSKNFLLRLTAEKGEKFKYESLERISMDDLVKAIKLPPFNLDMKTLCWKLGESFVKVSGNKNDFYGQIYKQRREYENIKNEAGEYAPIAEEKLRNFDIGKNTDAYKAYSKGKLPAQHLFSRSKRYAVKIFISHLHAVMYWHHYKMLPPAPYAMGILGHSDLIGIPNAEVVGFPNDDYMLLGRQRKGYGMEE